MSQSVTAVEDACDCIAVGFRDMVREGSATERRFNIDTWRSLMDVHAAVLQQIESALEARHRVTVSEFDVLINLPREGARMRELRDRVVLSQSALSRLVDRLERRGLVAREGVSDDSRAVHIRLTAEGRKLMRATARTNADVVERAFTDRLSQSELTALHKVFGRLRHELKPEGDVVAMESAGAASDG
ncbi:MAG: MarR family winged helix-turn-helix transcriptional regulator [Haloechinothrix sp.]